jgi:starch synthase
MKNILFVASECMPFVKTGGLADVVGSLPKCIDRKYFDCRVIMPMYSFMNQKWKDMLEYKTHFYMDFNWNSYYVGVMEVEYEGVHVYFIDNQDFFTCDKPYAGMPYDIGRFAFFSKAALSILPSIDFRPDIIHCHDWQTGLIPVYLNDAFQANEFYRGIKTVMTIHNLKFQGVWDVKTMKDIVGLPDYYFTPDKMEFNRDGNMLKGGLVYANAITTVSRTYAEEIKMPYYGEGLDGLMRARQNDLRGIVNGIDYDMWNPKTDQLLVEGYDSSDFKAKKIANKTALQEELGLDVDPDVLMIGIVSRLTDQKGFDLIAYVMDELCQDAVQFVILGTGEERYENMFRHFEWK